jgi:hypothetical protein
VSNLTSTYSDDESCVGAPSSGDDTMTSAAIDDVSSSEESNEKVKDNFLGWIIHRKNC